eukprot:NODE_2517_length_1046_cov_51.278564_g2499_i0.p1 GENE.NODE_2517_length_1046_cov_51.278564_g2499_i0~~NODE_2517_length_1046_cov_51.278564_g2499_i0.p1  ORF type:complete len:272 (+),score=41.50 NODE_2517_length_1046_cov_51.278564_g2499_i0:109-924(+)
MSWTIAAHPTGWVVGGEDSVTVLNDGLKQSLVPHPDSVTALSVCAEGPEPDPHVASGCHDGKLRVWKFEHPEILELDSGSPWVNSLTYWGEASLLIVAGVTLSMLDFRVMGPTWKPVQQTSKQCLCAALCPDNRYVASAWDSEALRVYDLRNEGKPLVAGLTAADHVTYSPCGRYVAAAGAAWAEAVVADAVTLEPVAKVAHAKADRLCWDQATLTTACDGTINCWNVSRWSAQSPTPPGQTAEPPQQVAQAPEGVSQQDDSPAQLPPGFD